MARSQVTLSRSGNGMKQTLRTKVLNFTREEFVKQGSIYRTFEVVTAVTMKNANFLDIKTQFVPHRKHIAWPLDFSQLMLCKI
jgi:hypothetical protein